MAASPRAPERVVPSYFPRVAKECKPVSTVFFDCFTAASKYAQDGDANVGQSALGKCAPELAAYVACSEQHLRAKTLVQAPQAYLDQLGPAKPPQ